MKKGFTLIEMVVVVGLTALLAVALIEIMLNSLKAKNMTDLELRVNQEGTKVISEIRSNIVNADGSTFDCTVDVGSSSVTFNSSRDGNTTTLVCYEGGKIASESAAYRVDLTADDVRVSNCQTFAVCGMQSSGPAVSTVSVGFTMSSGDQGGYYSQRSFETKITVRN